MNGNDPKSEQLHFSLQYSESQIFRGACQIYAGYLASGQVNNGDENRYMEKAVNEAINIAITIDDCIESDDELSNKLNKGRFA